MINTLFILQKIDQLNLYIKRACINLCAVDKTDFKLVLALKKVNTKREDLVTATTTINFSLLG